MTMSGIRAHEPGWKRRLAEVFPLREVRSSPGVGVFFLERLGDKKVLH